MTNRVETMLGFAQKAGKLTSGEEGCRGNAKQGKAVLIILATDASENTKAAIRGIATQYQVKLVEWGEKEALGSCIGKASRAAIAVLDLHFAREIESCLK